MITSAILSLGVVMVFHSFFISLNNSNYLLNRLDASLKLSNKIWESQDLLRRSASIYDATDHQEAVLDKREKEYKCLIYPAALSAEYGFYDLKVTASWVENNKEVKLSRSAYVGRI